MSTSYRWRSTWTSYLSPHDPWAAQRKQERETCTCGLIEVGYQHSWAVQHANKCPAARLFDD